MFQIVVETLTVTLHHDGDISRTSFENTLLALSVMLIGFNVWRRSPNFMRHAYVANVLIMVAGFMLIGYQLTGFFVAA